MHIELWLGDLMERDHLEDLDEDGDNFKMNLQKVRWKGMKRLRRVYTGPPG